MVDVPKTTAMPPIPTARIGQLFASPSEGRMFPVNYEEAKKDNTLGLTFAGGNSAPPASIRHYNPGAIGKRSDDGHKLLGATSMADLPGSDGKALATPAFDSPEDGVAYYGYFIQARVGDQPTIDKIMKAYATGHPEKYKQYIKRQTGLDATQVLDEDQLASVAKAMFAWESGGTSDNLNAQAMTRMLDGVDIKAQIKRGRTAFTTQEDPGVASADPIAAIIAADQTVVPVSLNNNQSANDSIGQKLTASSASARMLEMPSMSQALGPLFDATERMTLDIDTSPASVAQRVADYRRTLGQQVSPPPLVMF